MRIAVIGVNGQIAQSLAERGPSLGAEIVRLGRPQIDLARAFDGLAALRAGAPDAIVNAAAYTAVDKAESEPDVAHAVNAEAAGALAQAAAELGAPFLHLSTDYVFDGHKATPYAEDDLVGPSSVYGRSKLAGERAVAQSGADYAVLRLAWVYSPFGHNFVKTMLRLAQTRDEISVVADQIGSPTSALDAAAGIVAVACNLVSRPSDASLRGIFHMAGSGYASWADLAEEIFDASAACGGPRARVKRITTAEYPTAARRPANSRLDCARLARTHGVALPPWQDSLRQCVERLVATMEPAAPKIAG